MSKYLEVNIDIDNLDSFLEVATPILYEYFQDYDLSESEISEYVKNTIDQWQSKFIDTPELSNIIQKIKDANPPPNITIKLSIDFLNFEGLFKFDDEITNSLPSFRPYMKSKYVGEISVDTYVYNKETNKFESLEITDYETLIDEGISTEEINNFYSFHQRLMETTSKKIKLYTAQPEERINQWNTQGFIPKNSYLTNSIQRAEYYFNPEENDIIVFYRVQENQLLMTSNAFGAKEYVTISDIKIE